MKGIPDRGIFHGKDRSRDSGRRDETQRRIADASKRALEAKHWFDKPIVTMILTAGPFYRAEEYHQGYHEKHPALYQAYKWGCGRGPFIARFWKDKPPIEIAPEPDTKPKTYAAGSHRSSTR